jgi:GH24 family phage-related lysozyme (muramidase)
MPRSSPAAIALLLKDESFVGRPYWPGGFSGVSLDPGYDLGQHTASAFTSDWSPYLPQAAVDALLCAIGVRGQGAGNMIPTLGSIPIPQTAAMRVFTADSLPQYEQELIDCMPGADQLPADVFGALTDLVYNRGPAMADSPSDPNHARRFEMRQLRSCVANFAATSLNGVRAGALRAMVNQLHTMGDRLWPNDEEGLKTRRYAEAALIEAVAVALDPTTP